MPIPFASRLPYVLHTNRELGLMLSGRKPLAVFGDGAGCHPDVVNRYLRLFDRHVASGRFVRRDQVISNQGGHPLHYVLFALPEEEWRIDAMLELKRAVGWSVEHERREGELLGYEDWMNDWYLAANGKS